DGNKNDGDDPKHANTREIDKHDEIDVYKCSNEKGKRNKDKVCNEKENDDGDKSGKEDDSNVKKDDDKCKKIHYSAAYTCSYPRIIDSSNALQRKSSAEYHDTQYKENPDLDASFFRSEVEDIEKLSKSSQSEKIILINKRRKLNRDDYTSILETKTDSKKESQPNWNDAEMLDNVIKLPFIDGHFDVKKNDKSDAAKKATAYVLKEKSDASKKSKENVIVTKTVVKKDPTKHEEKKPSLFPCPNIEKKSARKPISNSQSHFDKDHTNNKRKKLDGGSAKDYKDVDTHGENNGSEVDYEKNTDIWVDNGKSIVLFDDSYFLNLNSSLLETQSDENDTQSVDMQFDEITVQDDVDKKTDKQLENDVDVEPSNNGIELVNDLTQIISPKVDISDIIKLKLIPEEGVYKEQVNKDYIKKNDVDSNTKEYGIQQLATKSQEKNQQPKNVTFYERKVTLKKALSEKEKKVAEFLWRACNDG
nr:hypothetical protein [Tanacetum cinerariifolium]